MNAASAGHFHARPACPGIWDTGINMKKLKVTHATPLADMNIDQYCRSVEELLKSINNKPGKKVQIHESSEPFFSPRDGDDLFEFE